MLLRPFTNALFIAANNQLKHQSTCYLNKTKKKDSEGSECQTAFTLSLDFRIFCAWSRSCCGHAARSFSMAEMAASAYLGDAWASFLIVLPLMVMTCSHQITNLFFILSGLVAMVCSCYDKILASTVQCAHSSRVGVLSL